MTLVIAVTGSESIWLVADRRLSYPGRPPKDDGCKIMSLETSDGVAILGYAGLGATALGTEPSEWMSAVLRGRHHSLEDSLHVIAKAMRDQLPRHMLKMPKTNTAAHYVVASAFIGNEPRLYIVELVLSPDRKTHTFRIGHALLGRHSQIFGLGGSGGVHLWAKQEWFRPLRRVLKAHERRKISSHAVASHLAGLNDQVHLVDKSVGPRCIVAWRHRTGGIHNGGGAQQFYTHSAPDEDSRFLPSVSHGMQLQTLLQPIWAHTLKSLEAFGRDEPFANPDMDAMNAEWAKLPSGPDEKLR